MNNKIKAAVFVALGFLTGAGSVSAKTYNILDYGAKRSNKQLITKAIQAAIDACSEDGGGTVLIPEGTYVTGTLYLKSNITIQLEEHVILNGSSSLEDYTEVPVATEEPHFSKCLFFVENAENIKITGGDRSVINGRGYYFKYESERPKLFRIERCRNIELRNITVKNSGSWCVVFSECDSIFIDQVSVYNKEWRNNDGIDFDGCSNVWVTDCNLQVEDDALCLKSSVDKVCENINISGCTVSSYWAAIKFGTASKTGFKNVKVTNCQFFECRYGAIKLLAVDGAILENVEFSDIKLYNCGGPLFVRLGNRGRTYDKSIRQVYSTDAKPEGRPIGKIRNISIRNVEGRLTTRHDSAQCIMMTGLPGFYIENVVLENIHLSYSGRGNLDVKDRIVPEDEARYPEQSFFGVLPSYGIYLRHVKGLRMKNISLELRDPDSRPAVVMDDVVESSFEQLNFDIYPEAGSAMVLNNCQDLEFSDLSPSGEIEHVLELKGEKTNNIQLDGIGVLIP